jgi:para-nitrobenzyl esterase
MKKGGNSPPFSFLVCDKFPATSSGELMPQFRCSAHCVALLIALASFSVSAARADDQVTIDFGKLKGAYNSDHSVLMFKGVPFAAPPVGELRWKPPQPAKKWDGVRVGDKFGPPCMQTDVFGDILQFMRDAQPSEDCLNLTIWLPASAKAKSKLPVFVWYYGGGFVAGGNSEKRYDGEALAKKGVIVVEPNYRLGVFGFLSHPELSKESGHNSSGNYGLLDQVAAVQWVVKNIAAFGGDPHNITIGGESAGSLSVSALMASPLSRNLFQKAIGESGAFFPASPTAGMQLRPVSVTEQTGVKFAESVGAKSLAELRAKSAGELLQAAAAKFNNGFAFGPNADGYYLPTDALSIYTKREQAKVPLLAGWNADEGKAQVLLSPQKTTAASFKEMAEKRFGSNAAEFLKLYPATNDDEALVSAETLSGDDFIAFSTWKWMDLHSKSGAPVYRYHFEQIPKAKPGEKIDTLSVEEAGARHACEIEYVFQTLKLAHGDTPWADDDFKVSEAMATYWTNFVKTGNPNGSGSDGKALPDWPRYKSKDDKGRDAYWIMHLSGHNLAAAPDTVRPRYLFLDSNSAQASAKQSGASR